MFTPMAATIFFQPISVRGAYSTLYGGAGNDSIIVDYTSDGVYAYGEAGNDTFYVLDNSEDVNLDGGDGDDLFWFIKSSSGIVIEGGEGSNTYRFDPYAYGGPYHNDVIITDFTSDDTIEYFADYGYGGNERSDGSELDYYYDSDGNLVLYDANWNFFTVTLEGITQENVSEIVSAKYVSTKKTATLGEILGIEPEDGKVIVNAAGTAATITSDYSEKNFKVADYGTKIKTIDASETSQGIYITGNGLANKIIGGEGSDTLYGAKGNDTLTLKKAKGKTITLIDSKNKTSSLVLDTNLTLTNSNDAAVTVGAGKDTLKGNKGNDKLYGQAGADKLYGGAGNDTLWGGAGNDILYGNSGKDVFVYKPGEGTDKIMDYWYDDSDMLKILKADGSEGGTFKSATFDGDSTLTLAINGGGSVLFEEVSAGDKIKINSKTYTIKGRGLK